MTITIDAIKKLQGNWAIQREILIDPNQSGYTLSLNDNLYLPLSEAAEKEFRAGGGDELAWKMRALHSSSALVVNVFEYLRDHLSVLANALGATSELNCLCFEQPYEIPLEEKTPKSYPDVTLWLHTKPFVIESKFLEPYRRGTSTFSASYFPESGSRWWEEKGFPSCQALAREMYQNQKGVPLFSRLDATQLLKHILGLANSYDKNFTLLYLWHELPSIEALEHREEIEEFTQRLNGEVDFRVMTYTELFVALSKNTGIDVDYLSYLRERYFAV